MPIVWQELRVVSCSELLENSYPILNLLPSSNASLAATCVLSADGWLLLPSYASRTLGIPRLARVFCPIADPRFTHSVK